MDSSRQTRAELLAELGKIKGFLSLDYRRRQKKFWCGLGALYLITAKGYYMWEHGMYDVTYTITPEEYKQAKRRIRSGEIDWESESDSTLWMVRNGCRPGKVYIDTDKEHVYMDTASFDDDRFLDDLEYTAWKDVKTRELRVWLDRVRNIQRGYALLK